MTKLPNLSGLILASLRDQNRLPLCLWHISVIEVFQSGKTFMHVKYPHLYSGVEIDYEEGDVFHIQSIHCDVCVHFYD